MWTWVSGDNTLDNNGIYGTKGTAAAANKPGNRDRQSAWMDASGNFWVFGGSDYQTDYYNDLWKFNPTTKQWTWISGSTTQDIQGAYGTQGTGSTANYPGARNGQSGWVDASGIIWIFGGYGYDRNGNLGRLNDLWKFNPANLQWTWVSGSRNNGSSGTYGTKGTANAANIPGARRFQAAWVDAAGNFWIFGGYGYDVNGNQGSLNDLWKYNPTTNQWTWISGDNTRNSTSTYGTRGTAAAANKPAGRDSHSGLIDAAGNFWVFGGWDYNNNMFNDLWKFNPTTLQWTWMSGDNTQNNNGVYGTKGTGATTNKPGARYGQSAGTDQSGDIWIFGGQGEDANGNNGVLNDIFLYTPSTNKWTWVADDNTRNNNGIYGTKGTGATTNKPGGRAYQSAWTDASDNLWVFAGLNQNTDDFNDLWKYNSLIPLALQEITFQGTSHSDENVLSWQTTGEMNTNRFDVERSIDGTNFSTIGNVPASGSGNNSYTYTDDRLPQANNFFYRLHMVDVDGNYSYSKVIVLSGSSGNSIAKCSVFPNPTRNSVTLEVDSPALLNTPVRLFDSNGRLIGEWLLTQPRQYLDLTHVQKGICFLQLANGKTLKILKE